jgi:hypothetical protein
MKVREIFLKGQKILPTLSNICTIIGCMVTIIAVWYAYSQYNLYKSELQKTSDLNISISTIMSSKPGISDFEYVPGENWSKPKEISISLSNKGEVTAREIYLWLLIDDSIKVMRIDKSFSDFKSVLPGRQVFRFTNLNFPIPPNFPPLPIAKLEVRIAAPSEKQKITFGKCMLFDGKNKKIFELSYDYNKQLLEEKVVDDSDFYFMSGQMDLNKTLGKSN